MRTIGKARWLLALGALALAVGVAPAAAAPLRITHWEMELSLMRHSVVWDNGYTTTIDDAYCTGFGKRLTRPARYSLFSCQVIGVTAAPGCDSAELDLLDDITFDWWYVNCNLDDRFVFNVRWNGGDWSGVRQGE